MSAQDEVRNWGTDFDGLIGISIGQAVPLGSFAASDDTIQSGYARTGRMWNAHIECRPADFTIGLMLRYGLLRLPFHARLPALQCGNEGAQYLRNHLSARYVLLWLLGP